MLIAKERAPREMTTIVFQYKWYDPCHIVAAKYPRFELVKTSGKAFRAPVYARQLRKYFR